MKPFVRLAVALWMADMSSRVHGQDQFFFSADGVRIRYIEQGSGEPVVLVHGDAGSLDMNWVEPKVFETLAKNFRVIALDCRGYGKSGKPHDPKLYGAEMAWDVLRLLDHLKIRRAHIVGHAMGSLIAAKLLTLQPKRFLSATLVGQAALLEPTGAYPDLEITSAQAAAIKVPTLAIMGGEAPLVDGVRKLKKAMPALKVLTLAGASHADAFGRPEIARALQDFLRGNAIKK
jgi:pimeloyl-ACP methyl ester carboxylesterase